MPKAVYLSTGDGWGKTTSAVGVALRAHGHGKRVVFIQFMKGRKEKIGEYKAAKRLRKGFVIREFGREEFVDLRKPTADDKCLAMHGIEYAREEIRKKPFLIVLDEINLAAKIGLVGVKDVIATVRAADKSTVVYLTGRGAPKELIKLADYVTEIKEIKRKKIRTNLLGIDY